MYVTLFTLITSNPLDSFPFEVDSHYECQFPGYRGFDTESVLSGKNMGIDILDFVEIKEDTNVFAGMKMRQRYSNSPPGFDGIYALVNSHQTFTREEVQKFMEEEFRIKGAEGFTALLTSARIS